MQIWYRFCLVPAAVDFGTPLYRKHVTEIMIFTFRTIMQLLLNGCHACRISALLFAFVFGARKITFPDAYGTKNRHHEPGAMNAECRFMMPQFLDRLSCALVQWNNPLPFAVWRDSGLSMKTPRPT